MIDRNIEATYLSIKTKNEFEYILNECFVFSTNKFGVARMLVKIG